MTAPSKQRAGNPSRGVTSLGTIALLWASACAPPDPDDTATDEAASDSSQGEEGESESAEDSGPDDGSCGEGCAPRLRVVTWNVEGLGAVGSSDFAAIESVLARLGGDVVCLQEVYDDERSAFSALAATDYPHRVQADLSGILGGPQTTACLSRYEIASAASLDETQLASDPNAEDLGRDLVGLSVVVPSDHGDVRVQLVAGHLKAGQGDVDRFRRQVETIRLLAAFGEIPWLSDDPAIVLGDLNATPDDAAVGQSFATPPADLPNAYVLGDDIVLPVTYDPLGDLAAAGFSSSVATLAGTSEPATHRPTLRTLDHVFVRGASVEAGLVYDACRDDALPPLALVGAPLACSVTETASDHWPVVVDLVLSDGSDRSATRR